MHVIQNKDKNVIIKSTKCEKIFISWIHKVFKQIVSPFKSGCHLYSDRDQQTGNSCRYGNIRKNFILPFIGNSELKFVMKKVAGTKGQLISKWFLGSSISSKKMNEGIRLYYYDTSGRLVFVRFLGGHWN